MPEVTVITQELNGKQIAFHSLTVFRVQVGRGRKGSYKNRFTFTGNLTQAVKYYNSINIGNCYKKRLVMEGGTPPVLARATSY